MFGEYIVVLWSMWWTVWKEIWFNESYAVSPLVLWMLQWRVERETLYKDSCLWMQCSCGVWINRSYGKSDLKINFGWFMRLSPVQYLWEKFVHGVCLKESYFDVSWTGMSEAA